MKKRLKKLVLNRETLVQLDRSDLEWVAGGITRQCPYSGEATCTTCQPTCTTNLCP